MHPSEGKQTEILEKGPTISEKDGRVSSNITVTWLNK